MIHVNGPSYIIYTPFAIKYLPPCPRESRIPKLIAKGAKSSSRIYISGYHRSPLMMDARCFC